MDLWQNKRAYLFGCNYPGTPNALQGCVQDVTAIKTFLMSRCNFKSTDVFLYADTDPNTRSMCTRKGFLETLRFASTSSVTLQLDGVFIYYSGHGTYSLDKTGNETDGRDDCIFCTDAQVVSDNEIGSILRTFGATTTVVAGFDSCYSGTVCDLPFNYTASDSYTVESKLACAPKVISISGCRDNELSQEAYQSGTWRGAMTCALLTALQAFSPGSQVTWLQLLDKMLGFLKASDFTQVPQLCCSFSMTSGDLVLGRSTVPPYTYPVDSRTYTIESSARSGKCKSFLSVQPCNGSAKVDLWDHIGNNQRFRLDLVPGTKDTYYIVSVSRPSCNNILSAQGCRGNNLVDMWSTRGPSQQWQLLPVLSDPRPNVFWVKNRGRVGCSGYMSVQGCTGNRVLDLYSEKGPNQMFVFTMVG